MSNHEMEEVTDAMAVAIRFILAHEGLQKLGGLTSPELRVVHHLPLRGIIEDTFGGPDDPLEQYFSKRMKESLGKLTDLYANDPELTGARDTLRRYAEEYDGVRQVLNKLLETYPALREPAEQEDPEQR